MSARDDYAVGGEAGYTGDYTDTGTAFGMLTGTDRAEWAKMQQYTAAPQQAEPLPWWQNLVGYGVTKAIDNTFPTQYTGIQGNTNPGTFAGANGMTYQQRGSQAAAPLASVGNLVGSVSQMSPIMLALIGAAIYFAMKK